MPSCRSHKHAVEDKQGNVALHKSVSKEKLPKGIRKRIVEEAMTWEGTPYKYAGDTKGTGTDCSGMVMRVYEEASGIKVPRNSRKQADFCESIKGGDVSSGDLAFFATGSDKNRISHVGIMIDSKRFIHASSKKGVIVSEISAPYYKRTLIMFGRVPGVK